MEQSLCHIIDVMCGMFRIERAGQKKAIIECAHNLF